MSNYKEEFVIVFKEPQETLVCSFCLTQNSSFVTLKKCKHLGVLDNNTLNKIKITEDGCICYQCHHFLNKINLFRKQVEESLDFLNNQNIHHDNKISLNRIQLSNIETYSNEENLESNFEIDEAKPDLLNEVKLEDCEVKLEYEDSDLDNEIPLSEIKKVRKQRKRKGHKVLKGYEGKVSVIELSREEVMAEREMEKTNEMYLKFPFKCELCITGFDYEVNLIEHHEKKHIERDGCYTCDICQSVLSSDNSFKEHCIRHYKKYECMECGKRYVSVLPVTEHYFKQHSNTLKEKTRDYQCSICAYSTKSYRQFRYHKDKHKNTHECPICSKTLVNKSGLKVHMMTMHLPAQADPKHKCKKCDKAYIHKSSLLSHMASRHSLDGNAYCVKCKVHFTSEITLRHHLKTHSNHISDSDKKFVCVECGDKFLTNKLLREHTDWVHLKHTTYQCSSCSKVFKNSKALRRHTNYVHEKKRPPRDKICDYCGKGFTTLSMLRVHVRSHSGARPLVCALCGADFAHPGALYTHQQRHVNNTTTTAV